MRSLPLLVLAIACTGDKTPADSATPAVVYDPTWDGMQALFADNCSRCHPTTNGIDLVAEAPNHTTATVTGYLPWITPGEPDESWMWLLVSGQAGMLEMPADGLLPLETVDPMRVWIENGASFD